MNSILRSVLGSSAESAGVPARMHEDVPVPCAAKQVTKPTRRLRLGDRMRFRQQSVPIQKVIGEDRSDPDEDSKPESKSLIPDDAEEVSTGAPFARQLRPVKDVVLEPRDPYAGREKLMSPSAALTAPDATPDADQPIDPTRVPGNQSRVFRTDDYEREERPAQVRSPALTGVGPTKRSKEDPGDQVATAESIQSTVNSLLAVSESGEAVSGDAILGQGQPMPEHKAGDGKRILEAFRRFSR